MTIDIVRKCVVKFFFPFNFSKKDFKKIIAVLQSQQFKFQTVDSLCAGNCDVQLNQFFYPFIEEKILPKKPSIHHFNHYKKALNDTGTFNKNDQNINFEVKQLHVFLCSFNTGIVSIEVEIVNSEFLNIIDFSHIFRQLRQSKRLAQQTQITLNSMDYKNSEEILFNHYLRFLKPYLTHQMDEGYFGSLPYFEDERMFTLIYLNIPAQEKMEAKDIYKVVQLDGTDENGKPIISSWNDEYIQEYIYTHSYNRWEPHVYVTTTFQVISVITNFEGEEADIVEQHYQNTLFYNFLLHYFYKIVLLKLTYEHSEIKWSTDKIVAESLIEKITLFSSKYYFKQVAVHSGGRAISLLIRQQLRIDELYTEVKQSVNDLYRVLEDNNNDRYNQLLFILTVFTVISGIFGMNLVIESWDKSIQLSDLKSMSFFEVIAFFTGILGIWVSLILIVAAIITKIIQAYRKKRHQD